MNDRKKDRKEGVYSTVLQKNQRSTLTMKKRNGYIVNEVIADGARAKKRLHQRRHSVL